MKVKLTQELNIDPQAWAESYGIPLKDVRQDVMEYFHSYCQDQIDFLGCNAKPEFDIGKSNS